MITTIGHVTTIFFLVMRTFKIYSLSNLHLYNTVLLTIITTLYISFPEPIHVILFVYIL